MLVVKELVRIPFPELITTLFPALLLMTLTLLRSYSEAFISLTAGAKLQFAIFPGVPGGPWLPVAPVGPTDPAGPGGPPGVPGIPCSPVGPVKPVGPCKPVAPVAPTGPDGPVGPGLPPKGSQRGVVVFKYTGLFRTDISIPYGYFFYPPLI